MHPERDKSLKGYNTFGIDVIAHRFFDIDTLGQLQEIIADQKGEPLFVLGGGSNLLLTQPITATVLRINLKGIAISSQDDDVVQLKVMAGENWHDTVQYCVNHGYGGIENLSLIPGNIGAAPIQNIGAYGVELKDVFVSCEAIDRSSGEEITFSKEDCQFGYRDSFFKNEGKNKYIITSVSMKLTKGNHKIRTDYGAIAQTLTDAQITSPTIKDISSAVIKIRQSKLPDPAKIGNSGSFFKNPVIDDKAFESFHEKFPEAPFYQVDEVHYKVPAGWLIEQAGFKGKRYGDAGVHDKQALVLVNHGSASGDEIWELAQTIQQKVKEDFNIIIEPEVTVI
ncbi:MAG: UDP-N-acetylmuramate dehydrogenase [Gilvibacter sp.]